MEQFRKIQEIYMSLEKALYEFAHKVCLKK